MQSSYDPLSRDHINSVIWVTIYNQPVHANQFMQIMRNHKWDELETFGYFYEDIKNRPSAYANSSHVFIKEIAVAIHFYIPITEKEYKQSSNKLHLIREGWFYITNPEMRDRLEELGMGV